MKRLAKRLVWLTVLLGAAAMTARWWSARAVPQPTSDPQWPPFEPQVPAARPSVVPVADDAAPVSSATVGPISTIAGAAGRWVLPIDGECPEGYPIKANDNSGIYHLPGGRFYARTKAERCYVDAESAAADGYRAAKA